MQEQIFLLTLDTMRKLLHRAAHPHIKRMVEKLHAADIAHLLSYMEPDEKRVVFNLMDDINKAGEVLRETDPETNKDVLEEMNPHRLVEILDAMPQDDVADIVSELPEEMSKRVLELMREQDSRELEELMQYKEDTAGGIMTTEVLSLNENLTVEEAMKEVRIASEAEMVFYIYVVDDEGHLVGVVSLRQLLTAPLGSHLKEIMRRNVWKVHVDTDQEHVARIVARYNILAVPVVDDQDRLVGIVTVDDVIDILRAEATEDMVKMAGSDFQEVGSRSVFKIVSARNPWILASWMVYLVVLQVIGHFEDTLSRVVILAGFMPMITGMTGNVTTQSSTIVVRGLATGRINVKLFWQVIFREFRVGLLLGCIYGLLLGGAAMLFFGEISYIGPVVGLSICASFVTSATISSFIPLLLERSKVDPAVAAGPFVTTIMDLLSITIYFLIATAFMLR